MALKSTTFPVTPRDKANAQRGKSALLDRHHNEIKRALSEAKSYATDRQRLLNRINSKKVPKGSAD